MVDPKPAENPAEKRPEPAAFGTLAQKPLAHLLVYALDKRLTGSFELCDARNERARVYIGVENGGVMRVATTEAVAYLGHVLYEIGYIDDATLSSSLAEVASKRKLHGQVLLERGAIDASQLAEALRTSRARKLSHAFQMPPESKFAFYDKTELVPARPGDVEAVDPMPMIWRGVRENPSREHVLAALGRLAGRPIKLRSEAQLDRFGFDPDERAAADCMRIKAVTVPELAIVGGLSSERTELLAYILTITKQVEVVDRAGAPVMSSMPPAFHTPNTPFPSGQYKRTISFAMRAVTLDSGTMRIPSPVPARIPSPMPGRLSSPLPPRLTPSRGTPAVSGPADLARKKSILDRAKWIDQEDYYKMLGVERGAHPEEVRTAFFRCAKVWHPDSLPTSLAEVRAECELVFTRMTTAYETLSDPVKARAYESSISRPPPPSKQSPADRAESREADALYSQAEMNYTLGELREAENLCRKALVIAPGRPEAIALLAYIVAQDPKRKTQEHVRTQIKALDMAVGKDPHCPHGFYFRAMLHKRLEDHDNAVRDLRLAVTNDPDDVEAQKELRIYEQLLREGTVKLSRSMSPSGGIRRHSSGSMNAVRPPSMIDKLLKK